MSKSCWDLLWKNERWQSGLASLYQFQRFFIDRKYRGTDVWCLYEFYLFQTVKEMGQKVAFRHNVQTVKEIGQKAAFRHNVQTDKGIGQKIAFGHYVQTG